MEANEYMLGAAKEKGSRNKKDDDYMDPPSGSGCGGQDTNQGQPPENKGTLILDATCTPSDIHRIFHC